jgi:hypothetical protein
MVYRCDFTFCEHLAMPTQADYDEDGSQTGTFRPAATQRDELAALERGLRRNRARTFILCDHWRKQQRAFSEPEMTAFFDVARRHVGAGLKIEDVEVGSAEEVAESASMEKVPKENVELVVLGSSDEQMCAAVRTESLPDKHFDMDLYVSFSELDEYEATALRRLLTTNIRTFLTAARQENAEHRIKQLVQAIAPEDPLAEIELKVAQATIELRRKFLERVPTLTSAEVHKNAGFPGGNASQTVLRWRKAGKIFGINHGGRDLYPAFQFGADGRPLPAVADVLEILRRADDASDWDTALWFAGDSGWLAGKAPIDALQSDPAAVRQAAEQEVLRDEY